MTRQRVIDHARVRGSFNRVLSLTNPTYRISRRHPGLEPGSPIPAWARNPAIFNSQSNAQMGDRGSGSAMTMEDLET